MSEHVKIVGRIGIEQKSAIANLKQDPGHFEIDIIFGLEQKYFLLTMIDKANNTLVIMKLLNKLAKSLAEDFS